MPIFAPNWIFSRFTTGIFGGVRILLVGQCIHTVIEYKYKKVYLVHVTTINLLHPIKEKSQENEPLIRHTE